MWVAQPPFFLGRQNRLGELLFEGAEVGVRGPTEAALRAAACAIIRSPLGGVEAPQAGGGGRAGPPRARRPPARHPCGRWRAAHGRAPRRGSAPGRCWCAAARARRSSGSAVGRGWRAPSGTGRPPEPARPGPLARRPSSRATPGSRRGAPRPSDRRGRRAGAPRHGPSRGRGDWPASGAPSPRAPG